MDEMVSHIYGRKNILNSISRPNMFVNELNLYVDYLKNEISKNLSTWTVRQEKHFQLFKENLIKGVAYYKSILLEMKNDQLNMLEKMRSELESSEKNLRNICVPKTS